jgi:hypothetical protein
MELDISFPVFALAVSAARVSIRETLGLLLYLLDLCIFCTFLATCLVSLVKVSRWDRRHPAHLLVGLARSILSKCWLTLSLSTNLW